MVKICHISSAHPRYDTRILYRECASLKENGYDVTFVVNDNLPEEYVDGVHILTTGLSNRLKRLRRMTKGVSSVYKIALEADADLYHLHDPELLLIALKLKKHGKKVIFDSHENYYEQIKTKEYLPKLVRIMIASIYLKYETYVCRKIDGVIMPATVGGRSTFENRCKSFTLVNNLPRLSEFKNDKLEIKAYKDRADICYSGGLTYARGIFHLAKASAIAGQKLVLAGRFSPESFGEDILNGKYSENIIYRGFMSREDTYKMYSECAIGMSTLLDVGQYAKGDNLPTKVYEYMAMEMPVILSNFPYYTKAVEEYGFGLTTDPANPEDIAEKIRYLMEHKNEAEAMGKRGREAVEKVFNWSVAEKNLLDLYREILEA